MRVTLLYNRIGHHARQSGYDQLAGHLGERVSVERLEGDIPRLVPWPVWQWITDLSGEWIARQSGMPWYDPYSFTIEARAAFRVLVRPRSIYHVLYGENTYRYLAYLSRIARAKGSRIVCSYHQPPDVFERMVACKHILARLDAVIAVASNQTSYFASLIGGDRVFLVPHGVDTHWYRPGDGRGGNGKLCIFVGEWLRDLKMLRAVVERIWMTDPRMVFKIITRADIAVQFDGLKNVVTLTRISDADLLKAYQSAGMMVLPLIDCTANNSLLEGLACGLPIVTTGVGGVRDYVDSSCARIVPPGDVEGMCEAILALSSDDRLRMEMGYRSRVRALGYDWPRVAERMIGVYEALGHR